MRHLFIALSILFLISPSVIAEPAWVSATKTEKDIYYEAIGTVQPRMITTLSSKVMGNVLQVLKREGDPVKEGEVVVKIDAKDIASDLAGARAGLSEAVSMQSELEKGLAAAMAQKEQVQSQLKLAESTYERMKGLFDKKSVSKQEFEQTENQVNSARAQLKSAEAQIAGISAKRSTIQARMGQAQAGITKVETIRNLAEVTAPFSGRVTSRKIEPGMLAAPGVPLLMIEDDSHLRVEAIIPESLLATIAEGNTVQVGIDALGGKAIEGKVAEIAPSGDALSHTFIVKIAVPLEVGLRTGMYARGRFIQGKEQVMLIPRTAIESRGQLDGIWIERNGKPVFSLIRSGRTFGDQIEILSGLLDGEKFLAEPLKKGSDSK